MRRAVLGILLGIGLVTAACVAEQRGEVYAQHGTPAAAVAANSEVVVVPATFGDKCQVLTVIDPRVRVLSVYHIDLATGTIALKSVRNIQWDLQVSSLNNDKPLPQEIESGVRRAMLEPR